MNTLNANLIFSLFVALQADTGWCLRQHTGIFAGMFIVTRPALTFFDRYVLGGAWDIFMTCKAEAAGSGQQADSSPLDLVAVVAVSAAHRRMDYLAQKPGITGAVLGMAVGAPGCYRIALMCFNKLTTSCFMAGTAQGIIRHSQQSLVITHVRDMACKAAVIHR